MENKKRIFLSIFMVVLLSGCWDDVEIEDRAFLAGVAIDLAEEGDGFEMTEQLVVPAGLATTSGGGGGEEAYRNLSDIGGSLQGIHSAISRQENRKANTEHLDLILISREVVENDVALDDVLDVFIRLPGMRRGIVLAITDGKAKDLLDLKVEHAKLPSQYLVELTENENSSATAKPKRIGDIQESMIIKRSFIVPLLTIYKENSNSAEYSGLALFNGETHKLVGVLQGDEAKGVQFIVGENQHGSVTTNVEGDQFSFLIKGGKSKKKLKKKDKENLEFHVSIEINAAVAEYTGSRNLDKKSEVERFEKVINEEIKKRAEEAIKAVKDEYQVDVFNFQDYLRMYHNDVWKKVEKDWDYGENYFSKSTIKVDVKSNLFRPGSSAITE